MRDIKFRGKRIDNGEWVYGHYCYGRLDIKGNVQHEILQQNPAGCYGEYIDPATVGQFTGMKDKNGVEIYEGDWTEASWGYSGLVDMEGIMYAMAEGTISDDIIVCSNIHDTPEPWKEESDV